MTGEIERHEDRVSTPAGLSLDLVEYRRTGGSRHVGLVLPGRFYTCDRPVLHFTRRLLLEAGAEVLEVHYRHDGRSEPSEHHGGDVRAVVVEALGGRDIDRLTLVGKSAGTRILAHLVSSPGELFATEDVRLIGYTPLFREPEVRDALLAFRGPALHVIGSHDEHYDPGIAGRLHDNPGARLLVIDGADHALESAGNMRGTLEDLAVIVNAAHEFIHDGERP